MSLRAIRLAAWIAVAVAAAGALTMLLISPGGERPVVTAATIGGDFELIDQRGATVTEASLQGHPSALFFGYTHCPDVCPTTLFEATVWMERLGADAAKLHIFFVTIDPERDTPDMLAEYLQAFDPRITGLTGSREAVDEIIAGYRVFARKVPGDETAYTMDHTATVYLLDARAHLVGTIDYQEDPEIALAKLKRLVGGS